MKDELDISPTLGLPLDSVTQRGALLAVSGAGKSNAARAMAEEFFAAELPFVAFDPKGDWWGMRAGRDGKPKGGLDVAIFGGRHGDVPLEPASGKLVADLVVDSRLSCILDLSQFESKAAFKRFLLDFTTRLYRRNENPLHLFCDEADEYAPQKPQKDELALLGMMENLVRKGRTKGIGVTMISQRSAILNKNLLTQIETLFAMRTTSPQDIGVVESWMKHHGGDEKMLSTLATLDDGEAWVWSPRYLRRTERIRFRLSHTFDSGATPKNYTKDSVRAPATLSDLDVGALREQMRETIEKIEAEDPVLLRRRIAELEVELRKARKEAARGNPVPLPGAGSREPAADLLPWRQWVGRLRAELELEQQALEAAIRRITDLEASQARIGLAAEQLAIATSWKPPPWAPKKVTAAEIDRLAAHKMPGEPADRRLSAQNGHAAARVSTAPVPPPAPVAVAAAAIVVNDPEPEGPSHGGGLGKGEIRVLSALSALGTMSVGRLAIVAGYKNGKAFRNLLSGLRTKGLVEGRGDEIAIAHAGETIARELPPPMRGEDLASFWEGRVSKSAWAAFRYVLRSPRKGNISADQIAAETGYKMGKAFLNTLSELRSLGLLSGGRDSIGLGEAGKDFS
jgi:hypothetical protein